MSETVETDSAAPSPDPGTSRTSRAFLAIRELILGGALPIGERISEHSLAERTGLSRTPIRAALQRLERDGLVETIPSGGFAIRSFSERDVFDAIEVRGALEGLAARLAAERGASAERLVPLHACLDRLDEVVRRRQPASGVRRYIELNTRFHALLVGLADSPTLAHEIARSAALPFGSPSSFIGANAFLPDSQRLLQVAQDQHRCAVEAIASREGARAQAIMQEHARIAARKLRLALRSRRAFKLVPGSALIRAGGRSAP
jgi:GntR family transcriptional regulator of vanillate catabolism